MGILTFYNRIYCQRVYPGRILAHAFFHGRNDDGIIESYHFRRLRIGKILVGILQGIDAILAGSHSTDREASATVRAPHPLKRKFGKSRVGQIGMQADQHPFHRFKISRIQHCAGHSHRVEAVARRERIEKIL